MKKISVFVLLGAMLAVFVPLGAGTAEAQAPPPWETSGWSGVGSTVTTFALSGPETLQVTDYQCVGDRFTVFVDGVSVGSTSNAPIPDTCGNSSIDEACALGTFSSGSFSIPAGDHMVEIRHLSGFPAGQVAYRTGPIGCNNVVPGQGGGSVTALCIEGDYVQANAQGQRVGNVFSGSTGPTLVATGGPTCEFNCIDGFDLNCDGKIGDFCPVELDRELVDDVKPCLAANEPAVAEVASVPATPPVAAAPTSLAFTGAESDLLGMIGAGMLSMGALALAASRRSRRRDDSVVEHWLD